MNIIVYGLGCIACGIGIFYPNLSDNNDSTGISWSIVGAAFIIASVGMEEIGYGGI